MLYSNTMFQGTKIVIVKNNTQILQQDPEGESGWQLKLFIEKQITPFVLSSLATGKIESGLSAFS